MVLDAVMARRGPPCGAVHTVNSLRPTVRTGAAIPTIHCPHQQQHHDRSDSVSCSSSIMNIIWDLTLFATDSLASLQRRPDWYRARAEANRRPWIFCILHVAPRFPLCGGPDPAALLVPGTGSWHRPWYTCGRDIMVSSSSICIIILELRGGDH